MKVFLVINIIVAIIGLCLLFYASKNSQPAYISIKEIDSTYIGKTISTKGEIVYVSYNKGHVFLKIREENSTIDVPIFSNIAKFLDIELRKGETISVTGIVDEYKGKLQIIPRKTSDIKVIE